MRGVQVKVYCEGSVSSLLMTALSGVPLMIEKDAKLVSWTVMVMEVSWFRVSMNESGPVILGGLLAVEINFV